MLLVAVPEPDVARAEPGERRGSYHEVLRHRAFVGVVGLNTLFVFAGMSGFELLPVFAKNEVGVNEHAIGLIFFVNTVVIVLAQLPIAKLSEGHRRMRMLAVLGVLWAACWVAVSIVGGNVDGSTAAVLLAAVMAAFGIGECIHGAVQAPLVSDLAEPRLLGRYMALSALSWQLGFAARPGDRRLPALGQPARHLARLGGTLRARRGPVHRPRADDPDGDPPYAGRSGGVTSASSFPVAGVPDAGSATTMTNMLLATDDPLSPRAEPAPHPQERPAAHRRGRRRDVLRRSLSSQRPG